MNDTKERVCWAIAFAVLLLIEIGIARFVRDTFLRPYGGDVLVVILLYCLIRSFFPRRFPLLPVGLFVFATMVEVLQYFQFLERVGLGDYRFITVIGGTTFSVMDLVCYGVGCLLCGIVEVLRHRAKPKR